MKHFSGYYPHLLSETSSYLDKHLSR